MAALTAQGPQLGLPRMIQERAQFGYVGVIFPLFATIFSVVAFYVIDVFIIKIGLEDIFKWSMTPVAVVIPVAGVLLAIYGHDWLHKYCRSSSRHPFLSG